MIRRYRNWLIAFFAAVLLLGLAMFYEHRENATLTVGIYSGSYWGTPTGNCYQIIDDAVSRFEEEHPGVTVKYVSGISTDAYSEWLAQQILKGTEPDVYFVFPEDFNLLVSSGALQELNGYMISDSMFDSAAYYEPSLRTGVFHEIQYALPYESVPTMMFVNKTLLEKCGIPMPDNNWTWDDFYSICAQVTDVEERRFGVYGYTWLDALNSNGASLFSEDGSSCNLSGENVQEAIRFVQQLNELNDGYTVTSKDFDLGCVAFRPFLFSEYRAYQPYPWRVKKYSDFEWDCICMPAGSHGGNTSELRTMLLGISSRSRNKDLAWEFAKLLCFDEVTQKTLYGYSHGISPLKNVAEDNQILGQLSGDIPGSSFNRELISSIMCSAVIAPKFDGYEQAIVMAQNTVTEIMSSNHVLDSHLLAAQREINIYLSK